MNRKSERKSSGIPHLAKNERDVGHPSFVRERGTIPFRCFAVLDQCGVFQGEIVPRDCSQLRRHHESVAIVKVPIPGDDDAAMDTSYATASASSSERKYLELSEIVETTIAQDVYE